MTYYLKYTIKNVEPVRIADDSIAQKGQTGTLHYIPGSAIRGYVITGISKRGFDADKEDLFTKVRFLNAYPVMEGECLMPSPKGFYEDKAEIEGAKALENVITDGKDVDMLKRARLGEFCSVKDDLITYYSVHSKGELKKRMYGNEMYRNEYIDTGYIFGGSIASENQEILKKISGYLKDDIYLGNGRSAGMGRCIVLSTEITEDDPYKTLAADKDLSGECYMMLLSSVSMKNEIGEPVGLNTSALQDMMGVTDLKIMYCSTSIRKVQGYNRAWHGAVPAMMTYDKGSVFHMVYAGVLRTQKIHEIMDKGIGDRLYEGFGRVVFLKDYEEWKSKLKGADLVAKAVLDGKETTDKETLTLIARKYYRRILEEAMDRFVVNHPLEKGMLNSSKTRGIEPILTMNRFDYDRAVLLLDKYFGHEKEKENSQKIHKELKSTKSIMEHVFTVLEGDLEAVLGVKTKDKDCIMTIPKSQLLNREEIGELKLLFLLKELRFDSRKEERA